MTALGAALTAAALICAPVAYGWYAGEQPLSVLLTRFLVVLAGSWLAVSFVQQVFWASSEPGRPTHVPEPLDGADQQEGVS